MNAPGWKLERKNQASGDVVFSKAVKGRKLFKLHVIKSLTRVVMRSFST